MAKQVEIEIDDEGNVHIDTLGFEGGACEDVHKKLSDALGVVLTQTDKPEKTQMVSNQKKQKLQH